jgi:hypothetical protein
VLDNLVRLMGFKYLITVKRSLSGRLKSRKLEVTTYIRLVMEFRDV